MTESVDREIHQVVFVDIEKYSLRLTATQQKIIEVFTENVKKAVQKTQELKNRSDLIYIPSGDGIALAFTGGYGGAALEFSTHLIELTAQSNEKEDCTTNMFRRKGYCDCCNRYYIRIGINQDTSIVYKDINGLNNVAGLSINLAARVMDLADRMQILVSQRFMDALGQFKGKEDFKSFPDVILKHGEMIKVFQYRPKDKAFINAKTPAKLKNVFLQNVAKVFDKSTTDGARKHFIASIAKLSAYSPSGRIEADIIEYRPHLTAVKVRFDISYRLSNVLADRNYLDEGHEVFVTPDIIDGIPHEELAELEHVKIFDPAINVPKSTIGRIKLRVGESEIHRTVTVEIPAGKSILFNYRYSIWMNSGIPSFVDVNRFSEKVELTLHNGLDQRFEVEMLTPEPHIVRMEAKAAETLELRRLTPASGMRLLFRGPGKSE